MKKRFVSVLLCLAMAASMLAGCGTSGEKKEEATEEKSEDVLTIVAGIGASGNALNAIAEDQGFLEEEGVELKFERIDGAVDNFTALSAGKIDLVFNCGTNTPLEYIASGEDFTIHGGFMLTGAMPVIAKKDTEWNSVEDFIGSTIAAFSNTYALTGPLLDLGYDPVNEIKWLEMDNYTDRVSAVVSGEADYAVLGTGQAYQISQMDNIKVVAYLGDLTPNYSCCRVVSRTEFVKDETNQEALKRLYKAWLRAQAIFEEDRDYAAEVTAEQIGEDVEFVSAFMSNPDYQLNVDPYKSAVVRAWGWMEELGCFKSDISDINIEDHINVEIYKKALDECVEEHYDENTEFWDKMVKMYEESDM